MASPSAAFEFRLNRCLNANETRIRNPMVYHPHTLIGNESPKLLPLQNRGGQHSPSNSLEGKTSETSIEFGNGEFSSEELKKIKENDKLVEIAMVDPKREKRILANRLSAACSKERKMRYISELELKVQTLQTESTTLSTQFTCLHMDNSALKSENNEYKLRIQALEQQSQLKDDVLGWFGSVVAVGMDFK
ncbi:bZIP transcription factor 30-like [Vigna umbellata]|uniref:bZIP transcription factor 30-like n=1 Tax=Vigna umbellata TaxID=87088 RepID=UPI001F5FA7E4|nr:bZIP transcription factor 30-like [Vigna umbellata]